MYCVIQRGLQSSCVSLNRTTNSIFCQIDSIFHISSTFGYCANLNNSSILAFNLLNTTVDYSTTSTCGHHPISTTDPSLPWLDSGASNNFFRSSDVSTPPFSPSPHSPIDVVLPNSTTISSIATTNMRFGDHKFPISVFKDNHLHHSLQNIATFTNDLNGSVTLDKYGATIRDASGAITNYSPKNATARIWTFNNSAAPTPHHASAVVRHDLHADFVAFAHASFNSPPNDTFNYALKHGFLRNFPHLTLDMWRKNKPNFVITAKSHLDLHRKNYRSTREQQSPENPTPPTSLLSILLMLLFFSLFR